MQREYICGGCGLFHWVDMYETDSETGYTSHIPYKGCPNEECASHEYPEVVPVYAVDTMGYAYFAEAHQDVIDEIKWSSPKYAPEAAIEVYKRQGIPIREVREV